MEKHLKIQDTCGIHNLHAMPGLIGGIVGAITAAAATESVYGKEGWVILSQQNYGEITLILFVFPSKVLILSRSLFLNQRLINTFDFEGAFKNMVPTKQGGHQAAGLCVAICFGIGGGIIVGKKQPLEQTGLKIQSTARCDDIIVPLRLYFKITDLGRSGWWQLF